MSLRLLYSLIIYLLLAVPALAQVYEPGLLVRSNGDTLRGEIENSFWVEPPTFIRYRRSADSPSELFRAYQLRAVSLTDGRYFRYESLLLDQVAETRLENLQHGSYVVMQADSVLAEVLLTGPVELLRVVRPGATQYVLRRPDRPSLSLSERKYLSQTATGSWAITDGNNYHNQLDLYFIDCPATRSESAKASFTAAGLVAVAQAYATACSPSQQPAHSWLAQAKPRRREAFQAGVLVGGRYHRLESFAYNLAGTRTDGGVHPFGGFYAELLQPSRVAGFYGELSLSGFRNRSQEYLGTDTNGRDAYQTFDYRALLATARIGVRFFSPLAHDQQLVYTLGFEKNRVFGATITATSGPLASPTTKQFDYAATTLLPNLGVGWRRQRLTLGLDVQIYASSDGGDGLSQLFFGTNLAARLGLAYRLGHTTDKRVPRPLPQP